MNSTQQRARRAQAAILTSFAFVTVVVLGWALGVETAVLAALTMPVPIALLWFSSDVLRADELREASARPERQEPVRAPSRTHAPA